MPKRKNEGQTEKQESEPGTPSGLEKAATAIGATLGTLAAKAGIGGTAQPAKKSGKLEPKGKKRMPRKLKKQTKKRSSQGKQKSGRAAE